MLAEIAGLCILLAAGTNVLPHNLQIVNYKARMRTVPVLSWIVLALGKRTIEFVASTEAVDRYGDIIRTSGWKLDNYRKNPVFLWAHKSGEPPIGRTIDVHVETAPVPALIQHVEFADAATYKFADTVFHLYKGGYMRAVSVGFMPLAAPTRITDSEGNATGGYEFTSQELLELSAVSLPANPEAFVGYLCLWRLARMQSRGFAAADLERVFTPAMSEEAVYRELIAVHREISKIAVGLATQAVRAALEALKKADRVEPEVAFEDLLAAVEEAGASVKEAETETSSDDEILSIDQLGAALGAGERRWQDVGRLALGRE